MRLSALPIVLLLASVGWAGRPRRQVGSSCHDLEGRAGTCGSISQCHGPLRDVWYKHQRGEKLNPSEILLLRDSARGCGWQGRQLLICCATQPEVSKAATLSVRLSEPVPPEQHPNRAILETGTACGIAFDSRIVGGQETQVGQFPWLAVLGYVSRKNRDGPVHFGCGGALIGPQHVLTAAHCVHPDKLRNDSAILTTVRLGEHDLDQVSECRRLEDGTKFCNHPQDFTAAKIHIHADYNQITFANDIALIKLDRPVVEDAFVGKVCLPFGRARTRNYTGVPLTVAGFGRTGPSPGAPRSRVLQHVQLPGVELGECATNAYYKRIERPITSRQLCAGGQVLRDSCGGDSGGPVVAPTRFGPPYSVVGLVSFGYPYCGEGGVPSVNTRVSEYLGWILDRVD